MTEVEPIWPTTEQMAARKWRNLTAVNWGSKGESGVVPAGFETDFASTPRALWWMFPPQGKYSVAAIVHDHLYHTQRLPRKKADRIFLDIMKHLKVGRFARRPMWLAVRAFGGLAWKKHAG